jgi:hypothetical protein
MTIDVEQTEILTAMARALISATPEQWNSALLELTTSRPTAKTTGLSHTISSPEGHRDIVVATDELLQETSRLQILHERKGNMFVRVAFSVSKDSDGDWRFHTDWVY